jgi:regulatory protein
LFVRGPKKLTDEAALYDYAIGALGRRMRSVAELKRLLRQRAVPDSEAAIERVVLRLKDQKYLNDSAYATSYSSYRRDNEKFGRIRVISDLKARGVHGDVIDKAVASAYDGADDEALARDFLRRKRIGKPSEPKHVARVYRTLLRAGFNSRTIVRVLNKWDVDAETLSALESEEQA